MITFGGGWASDQKVIMITLYNYFFNPSLTDILDIPRNNCHELASQISAIIFNII